jgi:hypothetical protein
MLKRKLIGRYERLLFWGVARPQLSVCVAMDDKNNVNWKYIHKFIIRM